MVDEYMKMGKAEGLRCPQIKKKAFNMFHFCALKEYIILCNKTNKCSCIKRVEMDMSYTRVMHIKVAHHISQMTSRLLRHTVVAMRAHNVLCNS
jgi:hypothetical protein